MQHMPLEILNHHQNTRTIWCSLVNGLGATSILPVIINSLILGRASVAKWQSAEPLKNSLGT